MELSGCQYWSRQLLVKYWLFLLLLALIANFNPSHATLSAEADQFLSDMLAMYPSLQDPPYDWVGTPMSDACQTPWNFLTCDSTSDSVLTSLTLTNKTTFPSGATLPNSFGAAATNLTSLLIFETGFSGVWPLNASMSWPWITDLNISSNEFSGSVPSLSSYTSLATLSAANNQFSGSLPTLPSSHAPHLVIDFSNNRFSGSIPDSYSSSSSSSISYLNLQGNSLSICSSFSGNFSYSTCLLSNQNVQSCGCQAYWSTSSCTHDSIVAVCSGPVVPSPPSQNNSNPSPSLPAPSGLPKGQLAAIVASSVIGGFFIVLIVIVIVWGILKRGSVGPDTKGNSSASTASHGSSVGQEMVVESGSSPMGKNQVPASSTSAPAPMAPKASASIASAPPPPAVEISSVSDDGEEEEEEDDDDEEEENSEEEGEDESSDNDPDQPSSDEE